MSQDFTSSRFIDTNPLEVDLAIIGAGPSGIYASYYAGFRGLSTAILDSLPKPGGQLSTLYPEKYIYDVAGFFAIRGRELVQQLLDQAAQFNPIYLLENQAITLSGQVGQFSITTSTGTTLNAKAILITTGIGTFTPRYLPAANTFKGEGISYFVSDPTQYKGKDVVIVGGGDSAFDWALSLEKLANSVTLIHRRDRFRAHANTVSQVLASSVQILPFNEIQNLLGEQTIEAIQVKDVKTGKVSWIETEAIIAALGFLAELGPIANWGIDIQDNRIVVNSSMSSTRKGIFAAGDISTYPGKVRLISVGFGEAATAVNNLAVTIDPSICLAPGHSSDK